MFEYLYALINPAMPGLVKVGKTTREPSQRADELSSVTGVPTRFILVHSEVVNDCAAAEVWVHKQLEINNYRVAQNREFFNAPLHVVIDFLRASKTIGNDRQSRSDSQDKFPITSANVIEELLASAEEAIEGSADTFANGRDGEKLLIQAAQLGSPEAHHRLARMYHSGADGIVEDRDKALAHFKRALEAGSWRAGGDLGLALLEYGKELGARAYLSQFFQTCYSRLTNPPRESLNGVNILLTDGFTRLKRYFYASDPGRSIKEIGANLVSEIGVPNHVMAPFVQSALEEKEFWTAKGEALPLQVAMLEALNELRSKLGPWDPSGAVSAREQILGGYPLGVVTKAVVTTRTWSWIEASVEGIPALITGDKVAIERPEDSRELFSIGDEIEVVLISRDARNFGFMASRKEALHRQETNS